MKKIILVLLLLSFILVYHVRAQQPVDRAVRIEVTINSQTSITLEWVENQYAVGYDVYRRMKGESSWGSPVTTLPANGTSYKDDAVEAGKIYEYYVFRRGSGNFRGYGYVMTGIDVDPVSFGKRVLVLVDKELSDSIQPELDMLQTDLAMAGWNVELMTMTSDKKVPDVKAAIDNLHNSKPIDAVYIIGHVAVPYSGKYCADGRYPVPPDGHAHNQGNHCGAWPADVYYGVQDGFWTDVDSITVGTRSHTANRIGDGKFDQIEIPGTATIAVGRVDFSRLPAFALSEENLTRQYIQKIHDYRNHKLTVYSRGIVDDNFKSFAESFSSTGWRNFAAMFGRDNVVEQDFFTTMKDSIYMYSMLDGAGSFTSCNGVGTTTDYANNNVSAMFNFTFGSFFGDWDVNNNLLRAALATGSGGLTNAWSGRPWWHVHPMALGHDIGFCTMLSQNNTNTNYYGSFFTNNIHIALMGDPTLRLYTFAPPTNVVATPAGDRKSASISWTASTENGVTGYDIYVSTSKYGYYEKLNSTPVTGTSFNHDKAYNGTNYYMVRARMMQTTPAGRFQNYSQGALGMAENMVGETRSVDAPMNVLFDVYPNPTEGILNVRSTNASLPSELRLVSLTGQEVLSAKPDAGSNFISLDINHLPSGLYFLKAGASIKKVVLN